MNNAPNNLIDPWGRDTYLQNRTLAAISPIGIAAPNEATLTHTFVYTTNPDGSLKHTYSWGNEYERLNGLWSIDADEDKHAAEQAIHNPAVRGTRVGDASLDEYVDRLVRVWKGDKTHPSLHPNFLAYWNCKSEAARLIEQANLAREWAFFEGLMKIRRDR